MGLFSPTRLGQHSINISKNSMKMLLSFFLSMNLCLLSIILVKVSLVCFTVPWSVLLTLFAVSLLSSLLVHMYSWRCWKYLRHKPQRLRSFKSEASEHVPQCMYVVFGWLWLMAGSGVGITYMCDTEYWPWSTLGFLPAVTYTASWSMIVRSSGSSGSSGSSETASVSSEDEPESSNVNTSVESGDLVAPISSGDSARGAVN